MGRGEWYRQRGAGGVAGGGGSGQKWLELYALLLASK